MLGLGKFVTFIHCVKWYASYLSVPILVFLSLIFFFLILYIGSSRALAYKQFISCLNITFDTLYWEF